MIKFKYLLIAITLLLLFLNFSSYEKKISHSGEEGKILIRNNEEEMVEEKIVEKKSQNEDYIHELTSLLEDIDQVELEEKLKDFREAIHSGEAASRSKFQLDSDERMLLEFASRQQKQKQQKQEQQEQEQQEQQQPELVSNLDRCVWSGSGVNQAEGNKRKMFIRTVALFNALNITYVLSSGSLLGALRESGGIKWDGDMDIVIPIWLNSISGNCEDSFERPLPLIRKEERPEKEGKTKTVKTLCGKSRSEWVKAAKTWMENLGKKVVGQPYGNGLSFDGENKKDEDEKFPPFSIRPRDYGGFRLSGNGYTGTDIIISIEDHYFAYSPRCKCAWHDIDAICYSEPIQKLRKKYGHTFFKPRR